MAGCEVKWKLLCIVKGYHVYKALPRMLDILSQNAKRPFSETKSVVTDVQNNVKVLLFLHDVLVSNGLDTRGLLTIST